MSNELKPCPFCGSKYISVIVPVETEYQVQCGNCYASSSIESTEKKAIKSWNRRILSGHIVDANKMVDDNQPLTLEELRGMNGEPAYIVFDAVDDGVLYELWALVNVNDGGVRLVDATRWNFTLHSDEDLRGITLYRRKPGETVTSRNDLRRKPEEETT